MISSRLIKSNNTAAGCVDIVDAYDPFAGNGVALYQLNGNANDVSGNYNGTATSVTYGTGVFGQAGVFNGTSSYVLVPDSAALKLLGSYTVSFWFKTNSIGAIQRLINKDNANDYSGGWAFVLNSDSSITWSHNDGSNNQNWNLALSITANIWYCVTAVYSDSNNLRSFYLNKTLQNTIATNTNVASSIDVLLFGAYGQSGPLGQYLNGSLDQVRIFNTALTPLEVEALYIEELCICGGTVDTLDILNDSSCIALYPLDGNANDLSGNYSGTPTAVSYGVGEFDLAGVGQSNSSIILNNFPNRLLVNSVSFWFNRQSNESGSKFCFSNRKGLHTWMGFQDNLFVAKTYDGSAETSSTGYTNNIGQWYHACLVSNNASKSLYINGTLFASYSRNDYNNTTSTPVVSIYYYLTTGSSSTAKLDQFRIFNKALNATEVTTLYNETACQALACSGTTNTLNILGDGSCIATYTLDGTPLDLSGNNNGLIVGTPSFPPNGVFNQCLIPSQTNYISVPPSLYNGISATSISLWFKSAGANYTAPFWATGVGGVGGGGWLIRTGLSGTGLAWSFSNTSNSNLFLSGEISTLNLNNGQWHHVVACWNGTTSTNGATLYLNNTLISSLTSGATYPTATYVNNNYIGVDLQSPGRAATNGVDQVRFFNKALSAGEVTTLYNETPCN